MNPPPNGFVHFVDQAGSGLRLAVKDNIDVAGMPTAAGLQARRGRIAKRDATCVAKLRAAGAAIVGKTLMDEAAFGALGDNPWFGRCHNPARRGYSAGGSSAGSAAAVAAGSADIALGTDTLGSVRIPAAYCGVVGYVPSAGRIPMDGVTPLAPSFDRVGLLARSVGELGRMASAFVDLERAADARSAGILVSDPRIEPAAKRLMEAGYRVQPVDTGSFDWGALRRAMLLVIEAEGAAALEDLLDDPHSGLSQPLRAALEYGRNASREKLEKAKSLCAAAAARVGEWLGTCDLLLLPATPQPAFAFDGPVPSNQADYATLSSLLGLPALSVPAALAPDELPFGVQLVAAAGQDARLLRAAALLA